MAENQRPSLWRIPNIVAFPPRWSRNKARTSKSTLKRAKQVKDVQSDVSILSNERAPYVIKYHELPYSGEGVGGKTFLVHVEHVDITSRAPNRRGVILYAHGNSTTVDPWRLAIMATQFDLDVVAVEYPGYGGAEGAPSAYSTSAALRAGYDYTVEQGYPRENIVLMGFSIGSGVIGDVAHKLAAEWELDEEKASKPKMFGALVLLGGMHSLIKAQILQVLDRKGTLLRLLKSGLKVDPAFTHAPVLLVHGSDDRIIHPINSEKLASKIKAAPCGDVRLELLEGVGHEVEKSDDGNKAVNNFLAEKSKNCGTDWYDKGPRLPRADVERLERWNETPLNRPDEQVI